MAIVAPLREHAGVVDVVDYGLRGCRALANIVLIPAGQQAAVDVGAPAPIVITMRASLTSRSTDARRWPSSQPSPLARSLSLLSVAAKLSPVRWRVTSPRGTWALRRSTDCASSCEYIFSARAFLLPALRFDDPVHLRGGWSLTGVPPAPATFPLRRNHHPRSPPLRNLWLQRVAAMHDSERCRGRPAAQPKASSRADCTPALQLPHAPISNTGSPVLPLPVTINDTSLTTGEPAMRLGAVR